MFLKECDSYLEFGAQNIRSGIEDYFGVRKKVAEICCGVGIYGIDALYETITKDKGLDYFIVTMMLNAFLIRLNYFIWEKAKKTKNFQSEGTKVIDDANEFLKLFRICFVLFVFFTNKNNEGFLWSLFPYFVTKFHDDDDRGIKNWAKGQIEKLKSSIKIPEAQPLPV